MSSSDESDSDSGFEDQGSSDEEDILSADSGDDSEEEIDTKFDIDSSVRTWPLQKKAAVPLSKLALEMNADDESSDDEDADGNTIGRVPLHWYDAYDHIGYDIAGQKLIKQKAGDRLDNAIANKDDPSSMHTVYDMYNDRHVVLSERDLEIIRRMQSSAFAHPEHNDTPDYIDYYSSITEQMPIMAAPEPKRRFIASKWEMMKIVKIAKAIKEGRYVFQKDKDLKKTEDPNALYMLWKDSEDEILSESSKNRFHLPAPKMPLPGHAESYNPPSEYLLSEEEVAKMEDQDPADRLHNFIPTKHSCLRHVAGYDKFIKERFERCLDLYLCPRTLKRRLNIDPQSLVPRLPKPKELRPFPNMLSLQYVGHTQGVSCITLSPDGEYMVSGSEDGTVRLWEVDTALCRERWNLGAPVVSVVWNPSGSHHLVAVATGKRIVLISTGTGDRDSSDVLDSFLSSAESAREPEEEDEEQKASARWRAVTPPDDGSKKNSRESHRVGPRVEIQFDFNVKHVAWHQRGDYMAALVPDAASLSVSVHQVSKAASQYPFKKKSPGIVQTVQFHPSRPYLFVATQQSVKVYHLMEQKLVKRLLSGCKWLSSMDIHQSGDHVIVGSYDRRLVWFDMDLSSTPYKTLKFHEKAVRSIAFHKYGFSMTQITKLTFFLGGIPSWLQLRTTGQFISFTRLFTGILLNEI